MSVVLPFQVPEEQWTDYIVQVLLPMFLKDHQLHLGDLSCEEYLKLHHFTRDTNGEDKLFGSSLEIQFNEILVVYKVSPKEAHLYVDMKKYVQYLRDQKYPTLCPVEVMKYLLHSLSHVLTIPPDYLEIIEDDYQNYLKKYPIHSRRNYLEQANQKEIE